MSETAMGSNIGINSLVSSTALALSTFLCGFCATLRDREESIARGIHLSWGSFGVAWEYRRINLPYA